MFIKWYILIVHCVRVVTVGLDIDDEKEYSDYRRKFRHSREIAQLLTGTSVPEYRVVIIGRSEEKLKLCRRNQWDIELKGECHFISGDTSSDTDVERMFANTMVIMKDA